MKSGVIIAAVVVIEILVCSSQPTAADTDKLLEIFGITNEDLGDSIFRQMVENLHDNEIFNYLNDTDHGFTLLVTDYPPVDDYFEELYNHPDLYASKYLEYHIILHRYPLEDLASLGTVRTVSGIRLYFKEYVDENGGKKYTVNGIECSEGGDLINPSINIIYLKEPLWFPPSPMVKSRSPFMETVIKKFINTCRLPAHTFQQFFRHFEAKTGLQDIHEPITYIIPPDNVFKYWCSVVFLNPFIVIDQLSEYILLGPIGPVNLNHETFVENILNEKVMVIKMGNHMFKILESVINSDDVRLMPDGKGYIYEDSSRNQVKLVEAAENMGAVPFKTSNFEDFFG